MPALNDELLARQLDTRKLAKFSVAVIVTGVPSAGRSETVNKLIEWLDPKYVSVRAFGEDDRIQPSADVALLARAACVRTHRVLFWGWYGEFLDCALGDSRKAKRRAERELERIRQLETMLSADGVRVVKIHLDLDAETQRKRLKKLRGNKLTRWRVTHEDLWLARNHKAFRKAIERCIAASDQPSARWHLIDGADEDYREVRVGELLRDEMHAGLGQAQKTVRARASKALKPPPLRRDRIQQSRRRRIRSRARTAAGKLALLTRALEVSQARPGAGVRGHGRGRQGRRDSSHHARARRASVPGHARFGADRGRAPLSLSVALLAGRAGAGHIAIFDRSWYGRVLVERVRGFAAPRIGGARTRRSTSSSVS